MTNRELRPEVKPNAISSERITAALRAASELQQNHHVVRVNAEQIGAGQLASSFRVYLFYDTEGAGPKTLVAKLPSADAKSFETATRIQAYARESKFYSLVRPQLTCNIPRFYGALRNDVGEVVGLLLADLSDRARPLDQLTDGTVEQVTAAVNELAALQAPFWDSPVMSRASWFYNRTQSGEIEGLANRYQVSLSAHQSLIESSLTSAQRTVVKRFGEQCIKWASEVHGPFTLVHQDFRLDNLLWGSGSVWIIDWQTLSFGSPAWDLAFLLGTALSWTSRRSAERELVRLHQRNLESLGVQEWDESKWWMEYRRMSFASLLAMVPAIAFVEQTSRGFEMFASMISRGAQHVIDLNALEFLD